MKTKNVALALASGGPRGFAYIGAIEVLQERGYTVTSVAGASAGSLVGGIFAAGGLEPFKQWLYGLDPVKVVSLMDFTPSRNYLVKGEKVIDAIRQRVPDVRIEDLPIPFAAVATDLFTGEEVVIREGPLFDAIRASISIPSMFRPVRWQGRTLVDGGLANTFPLNRVQRSGDDILVGFNVNRIDAEQISSFLDTRRRIARREDALYEEAQSSLKDTLSSGDSLLGKVRSVREIGGQFIRERIAWGRRERELLTAGREGRLPVAADDNYVSILQRSFGIMNHTIAQLGIALCPPDILVNLPFDSYHGVYGYSRAGEIAEKGRALMSEALDRYEAQQD
ncbi:MAG: patatin-like phospholipase family protein [Bacteroidales bacterium]|nr:patatin-like phospholipase family protein [Bacteroidales bacterium]